MWLDYQHDFEGFDFHEPITFWSRQPDQTTEWKYQIRECVRKTLDNQAKLENGFDLDEQVEKFTVWRDALKNCRATNPAIPPCPTPKVTDQITDKRGVKWVVRSIKVNEHTGQVGMLCQKAPG
jgi:hypothetical protein